MRDKLIELIKQAKLVCMETKCENCVGWGQGAFCFCHMLADHLLANGVIVPPCKVGDTVYYINKLYFSPLERNKVYRAMVTRIVITKRGISFVAKVRYAGKVSEIVEDGFGETIFLTREEAEQALKGARHEE